MIAMALCAGAFVVAWWLGRRSLWQGVVGVLAAGYAYGIVRANVGGASHLLFDAAVAGLFAAQLPRVVTATNRLGLYGLKSWTLILIAWPTLLFFFHPGDVLVELVGWRGNAFLLPFLLIGAQLDDDALYNIAIAIAILNIGAALVAGLEFTLGLEAFFPETEVTEILYDSRLSDDKSLGLRIPSTFVNAHAYGGTLVMTLPFVFGAWIQQRRRWHVYVLTIALAASILGVFMAGARTPMIVLSALIALVTVSGRLRGYAWASWMAVMLLVAWVVSGDARLQRFLTLQDTEFLNDRFSSSVNHEFFELMVEYPFGRGLAGGGTSIPYFLQDRFATNFVMENEFARIVMEQGIPGLALWLLFILWIVARRGAAQKSEPWYLARRLALAACVAYFLFGLTGIGLLTAVPQSMVMFLALGWICVRTPVPVPQPVVRRRAAFELSGVA